MQASCDTPTLCLIFLLLFLFTHVTLFCRVAFLTGITGQDGSYLVEFLLGKGYVVHGLIRRSSSFNTGRIEHLYEDRHKARPRLFLEYGDLSDSSNLTELMARIKPHEVYNLAAQSHVKVRGWPRNRALDTANLPSNPTHSATPTLASSRSPLK